MITRIGITVAAIVVMVGLIGSFVGSDDGPPDVASGPGVVRVHAQLLANGGQRAPEEVSYRGTTFWVTFGGVYGSGDHPTAGLRVAGPAGTLVPFATYARGARIEVDGAALEVRTVYAGSKDSQDLVDLQVIPPTG